jgi:hypothetical protein
MVGGRGSWSAERNQRCGHLIADDGDFERSWPTGCAVDAGSPVVGQGLDSVVARAAASAPRSYQWRAAFRSGGSFDA